MSDQYSTDPEIVLKWIMECYGYSEGDWSEAVRNLCRHRDREIQSLTTKLEAREKLVNEWISEAIASHDEADRIRRTIKTATGAEERCNVRAEIYDKCAKALNKALKGSEPIQGEN